MSTASSVRSTGLISDDDAYVITKDELDQKIAETVSLGATRSPHARRAIIPL